MTVEDTLTPADFARSAQSAIAACAGLGHMETAARLAGDGIAGIIAGEAHGGLALPFRYALPVLETAGAALLAFPLLETMLAARSLEEAAPELAGSLVAGEATATIAWTGTLDVSAGGERVRVTGIAGNAPSAAGCDWVIARTADGGAVLVPLSGDGVTLSAMAGLDVDRPVSLIEVEADLPAAHLLPAERWDEIEADALLGHAALILGCAEASRRIAEEHANSRVQFGKALSANQAMRHMLARQKMQVDNIRNTIESCFVKGSTAGPARRKAAYVAAVEAGLATIEKSIQVLGGMGFTWEMPLHLYLRWVRALQVQGDADGVLLGLGDAVLAGAALSNGKEGIAQ